MERQKLKAKKRTRKRKRRHHADKGPRFERWVCRVISAWVTGGKHIDVFWRTAMSGGRATINSGVRQAGDLTAVSHEGFRFAANFLAECKHRQDVQLDRFIVQHKGPMMKWWKKLCKQCHQHQKKPMLIARQNGWPTLLVMFDRDVPRDVPVSCILCPADNSGAIAVMSFEEVANHKAHKFSDFIS